MKPECPNYKAPRYYVNPGTDEGVEGSAMCDIVDKPCLVEYGDKCETYDEWLDSEYVNFKEVTK